MPSAVGGSVVARAIVVMGRLPVAGRVKTRLARSLGAETAAALYEAFLLDVFDLVDRRARALGAKCVFSVALGPDETLAAARMRVPNPAWSVVDQTGATLGDRIEEARQKAGAERVLILGSDAPHMPEARLQAAFEALEDPRVDAVFGPTDDGGYDLVAFSRPCRALLEGINWSTSTVMAETRDRASEAGLRLVELGPGHDVDELADLEAMLSRLKTAGPEVAPRSRRLAAEVMGGEGQKPEGTDAGPAGSH